MAWLRGFTAFGLVTWLLGYGITLADATLSTAPLVSACTCVHAAGAACPMHSGKTTLCRWRTAATPLATSFAFPLGPIGFVSSSTDTPAAPATRTLHRKPAALPADGGCPAPTSPPPRA